MPDLQHVQELLKHGRAAEALPIARNATSLEPGNSDAWFLLANATRALSQPSDARSALRQALLLQPFHPAYHAMEAELLLDGGQPVEAEAALRRSLSAKADFLPALSALGVLLVDLGRLDEARQTLERCVGLKADNPTYHNNLGACLLASKQLVPAGHCFLRAVQLDPEYFTARYNLARTLIALGDDDGAVPHLDRLLKQQPQRQEVLFLVGNLCHRQGDFETAFTHLKAAAAAQPPQPFIINALAEFTWEQGDLDTAKALYAASLNAEPANVRATLGLGLSLPMVAKNHADLASARAAFEAGLSHLESRLPALKTNPHSAIERDIQWANFLLAYQGQDDRALQVRYAAVVRELLATIAPDLTERAAPRSKSGKRIGFVSHHFFDCTAGRYFASWVTDLDRARFDTVVYHTNPQRDALTDRLQAAAGTFRHAAGLGLIELARLIAADELDVLIFPELGMHPLIFPLAAMRLAPIQCAGWGHPVTTGHANIDYFLSSAEMEPEGGASHYSEKLHCLPGLGTRYTHEDAPGPGTRTDYQLPEDRRLYLVPQSLYKIHPDNDAMLAALLAEDPQATLVMFASDRHRVATRFFVERLEAALKRRDLPTPGRVRILPHQSHANYLRINQLCDVMVDTLHWSGGHTSLDALATGLPIVTVEGRYMRGRQTAAMLRMLGADDLVVPDAATLASRAIQLATNPDQRQERAAKFAASRGQLFGRAEPVRALEAFLDSVLTR